MAKRHERTLARRMAVQVLYQSEVTGKSVADIIAQPNPLPEEGPLPAYALELLHGIRAHQGEIDEQIKAVSENWSLERMPIVDRAVLRMAVAELDYIDSVPVSVTINEAVELAKSFGGEDDSARFVNGILGRIAKGITTKPDEEAPEAGE